MIDLSSSEVNNIRNYYIVGTIPFMLMLIYYFRNIASPTTIEKILLLFAAAGMLFNMYFTYNWVAPGGGSNTQ